MSGTDPGLLAANSAFYEALELGDLDQLTALWVDGDEAVCVHPGLPPIHGAKAVMRSWAAILASTPYLQFVLTDTQAHRFGEVGVVSCTENLLSAPEGMPETMFAGGRAVATNVFRRLDGGWRLWVHHASGVEDAG
ncbi:MAG TPA: nuclear transport factor 2 family protein [Jiangellales bacterium]|nr:nuclear transport factor 2 family protein [Jiangellales bacterium]